LAPLRLIGLPRSSRITFEKGAGGARAPYYPSDRALAESRLVRVKRFPLNDRRVFAILDFAAIGHVAYSKALFQNIRGGPTMKREAAFVIPVNVWGSAVLLLRRA
jgi:hypothetical protein